MTFNTLKNIVFSLLANKQDKLIAGDNMTIIDNTISADGCGCVAKVEDTTLIIETGDESSAFGGVKFKTILDTRINTQIGLSSDKTPIVANITKDVRGDDLNLTEGLYLIRLCVTRESASGGARLSLNDSNFFEFSQSVSNAPEVRFAFFVLGNDVDQMSNGKYISSLFTTGSSYMQFKSFYGNGNRLNPLTSIKISTNNDITTTLAAGTTVKMYKVERSLLNAVM